jgi:hypothetical protein
VKCLEVVDVVLESKTISAFSKGAPIRLDRWTFCRAAVVLLSWESSTRKHSMSHN